MKSSASEPRLRRILSSLSGDIQKSAKNRDIEQSCTEKGGEKHSDAIQD